MLSSLWDAVRHLPWEHQIFFALALLIAFAFEFINGFHDTANAVTTVIYTGTLRPYPAVLYSGVCNFFGVLMGGTAVAFSIVNLLPVDLLIDSASTRSIVMVVSLLLAGVIWNLSTWWYGLPVSSSHTLIGSILGVGLANSLMTRGNASGVSWDKAGEVGLSLLISPLIGFAAAAALLLLMKRIFREPNLYHPPGEGDNPPKWVRGVLLATCGGVSFAHGSNDGQKGMGLILLALIGFLPSYYALNLHDEHGRGTSAHRRSRSRPSSIRKRLSRRIFARISRRFQKSSMAKLRSRKSSPWEGGSCDRRSIGSARTWLSPSCLPIRFMRLLPIARLFPSRSNTYHFG